MADDVATRFEVPIESENGVSLGQLFDTLSSHNNTFNDRRHRSWWKLFCMLFGTVDDWVKYLRYITSHIFYRELGSTTLLLVYFFNIKERNGTFYFVFKSLYVCMNCILCE